MSVLGNRVLRREDPEFLTVGGSYTADLRDPLLDSAAFVTYVRATMAHATITRRRHEQTPLALPGVLAVLTADDLGLQRRAVARPFLPRSTPGRCSPAKTVRYVGKPIDDRAPRKTRRSG